MRFIFLVIFKSKLLSAKLSLMYNSDAVFKRRSKRRKRQVYSSQRKHFMTRSTEALKCWNSQQMYLKKNFHYWSKNRWTARGQKTIWLHSSFACWKVKLFSQDFQSKMAQLLGNDHHSFWLPKYYNCNISEIRNILNSIIHTFLREFNISHHCNYEPAKFEYSDHLLFNLCKLLFYKWI